MGTWGTHTSSVLTKSFLYAVVVFISALTVTGPSIAAELFGLELFVRDEGEPVTILREISTAGFQSPFILHLRNGDENGENRVSSAKVLLNGQQLFGTSTFSQQVSVYDVQVDMTDPSTIEVWIASKPGSKLTIWIQGEPIPPGVIGPEGGTLEGEPGTPLEGVKLEFPPGAFDTDSVVTLELGDQEIFEQAFAVDPLSSVLNISIVGPIVSIQSTQPLVGYAELTLPYDGSALPGLPGGLVILCRSEDGRFEIRTGDPEGDLEEGDVRVNTALETVTTAVYHFSNDAVVIGGLLSDDVPVGCQGGGLSATPADLPKPPRGHPIDWIVLHSTNTRWSSRSFLDVVTTALSAKYQAHYYIGRAVEEVVVIPSEETLSIGETVDLAAEPRADIARLVAEARRASHAGVPPSLEQVTL